LEAITPYHRTQGFLSSRIKGKAGGLAQAVQNLPGKHKTLSSNPRTTTMKKKAKGYHLYLSYSYHESTWNFYS
jgi:hypothetical protein